MANDTMPDVMLASGEVEMTQEPQEAKDAVVRLYQDEGRMTAEIECDAPVGDGEPVTLEMLQAQLDKNKIVYGIDEEALARLASPVYHERIVVARGTPAVDGEDGECIEHFPREKETKYATRKDGSVDYKELGLIVDIPAGTLICEVKMPTEGTPGVDILGRTLKPRAGRKAVASVGEGTRASEDGTRIEAAISGSLEFRAGRFVVDSVYRVENVDYDVGNITFSGDVLVNGEMQDGFEIHSGGNITLRGQVGMALLEAKGDINIEKGINGSGRAEVDAGGSVKAGFIENCTVRAGKAVVAGSLINSQVECEGDVEVTKGKGIICGGKVTAFGSVRANVVGNQSNTLTVITLGVTPKLLKERKKLTDQLADVTRHLEEMAKNVSYIERLVADGRPVPPERVKMLQRIQLQMPMTEKKRDQLQRAIAELEAKMADVNHSTLTARILYPPTRVSIGALSGNSMDTRQNCRVYKNSAGELTFGSS